ncbi:hypothetical protein SLS56_010992 [Neofusicoccum ribis]|uniref:Heterokaryon incompatibility domain-containing protein n=1 Tax=Neofusicoccum ribis TaxID=45134 RepID=A0ABR3SEG2_9PEZI
MFDLSASIECCIANLGKVLSVMRLLQEEGFCEDRFSILVADPKRRAIIQSLHFQRAEIDEIRGRLQLLAFHSTFEGSSLTKSYEELTLSIMTLLSPLSISQMQALHWIKVNASSSMRPFAYTEGLWHAWETSSAALPGYLDDEIWRLNSVAGNESPDLYREIYTERGTIYRVARSGQQDFLDGEIVCHLKPLSALATIGSIEEMLFTKENGTDDASMIPASSTLLIGKIEEESPALDVPSENLEIPFEKDHMRQESKSNLIYNAHCKVGIQEILEELAEHVHFPGSSEPSYEPDSYQISGNISKVVSIGASKTWKRTKGTTYKEGILSRYTMNQEDLLPILNLFIGLEVSHCTTNARRITLWEALKLANTTTDDTTSHGCTHAVGQIACLKSCWRFSDSRDRLAVKSWTSAETATLQDTVDPAPGDSEDVITLKTQLRAALVRAMARLEKTGVRNGSLQAWYPFTQYPCTVSILPHKSDGRAWMHMLQESMDTCSFVVISRSCLIPPTIPGLSSLLSNGCPKPSKSETRSLLQTTLYCVRIPAKKGPLKPTPKTGEEDFLQHRILYLGDLGFFERLGGDGNVLEYHWGPMANIAARMRTSNKIVVREVVCREIVTRRTSSFLVI